MSRSKRTNPRRDARAGGFTLLEVTVALAIAALGMTLLLGAVSRGLGNTETAFRYLEATRRAQSHLAEIGVTSALTPGTNSGDDGGGFSWRTRISEPDIQRTAPGKPDDKPLALYTVEASIRWQVDGDEREVSLQSKRLGRP
jgi:prepilin-type N-terminal cleavage/methylation domain-containing protein